MHDIMIISSFVPFCIPAVYGQYAEETLTVRSLPQASSYAGLLEGTHIVAVFWSLANFAMHHTAYHIHPTTVIEPV